MWTFTSGPWAVWQEMKCLPKDEDKEKLYLWSSLGWWLFVHNCQVFFSLLSKLKLNHPLHNKAQKAKKCYLCLCSFMKRWNNDLYITFRNSSRFSKVFFLLLKIIAVNQQRTGGCSCERRTWTTTKPFLMQADALYHEGQSKHFLVMNAIVS